MKPNIYRITNKEHAARVLKYLKAEKEKAMADHGRPTHLNADGSAMIPPTMGRGPFIDLADIESEIDDDYNISDMSANDARALIELARRYLRIRRDFCNADFATVAGWTVIDSNGGK